MPFRARSVFQALLLLVCAFGSAQQSPSPQPANPDYSKEAFVVEQYSTTIKFEDDGTGTREIEVKIRVLSDAGVQRLGLLSFQYEATNESINIEYVRVQKSDGTVVTTPPTDVQDMTADISRTAPLYTDTHEKHVTVKGLGAKDLLEYKITWRVTKPLIPGQFWYSHNFSDESIVLEERLQIEVPAKRAVKWSAPASKPVLTQAGDHRVFSWTTSNLVVKTSEPGSKNLEAVTGTFPPADVQLSSFQTWDEVGRWYSGLQTERVQPTPEIRAKANDLIKAAASEEDKIKAIYGFVSSHFRYIGLSFGIGRYQPHFANEVLSNQYGDCKDKHTLLAALLEAVNIPAYPALINTSHKIDIEVPSPAQFDHVITIIPRGKDNLWLDATTEVAPFSYLLQGLRNNQALVIPTNKPASFFTTPDTLPFAGINTFTIEGALSSTGVLDAKMDQTLRGDLEIVNRLVFRGTPQTQWKDVVQQVSYLSGFAGTVSDVVVSAPDATDSPFHIAYTYNRNDYSDWENKRITAPFPNLRLPGLKDDQTNFIEPLWLGAPGKVDLIAKIKLPEHYEATLPNNLNLQRNFAEYKSSYAVEHGVLTAERHLIVKMTEVPTTEFQQYKSLLKAITDDIRSYIVLSSSTLTKPDGESSAMRTVLDLPFSRNSEANRFEQEARDAASRHEMEKLIENLRKAVTADPNFTRAWLSLGSVYMALNRPDEGLEAFRKGVASNSNEPLAYRMLGFALQGANKEDEAVEIWKQLLKIIPNDGNAAESLGNALIKLKRYSEAVTALQMAVKANPESFTLQMRLGTAYLKAGNKQDGMTAFRKVLELKSDPEMFNDVAYELAEANEELPQALEYAQRAVKEQSSATEKFGLASLQLDDLRATETLGACWDTLGWVYFRLNNFEMALKYLNAAWSLTRYSTVANHLAQLRTTAHDPHIASLIHNETSDSRRIKLPRLISSTANGEFFILMVYDPLTKSSKVREAKFVSGSPKLKPLEKFLLTSHIHADFPDEYPTRLVRRGTLGCYPTSGCALVLFTPDSVHSLN